MALEVVVACGLGSSHHLGVQLVAAGDEGDYNAMPKEGVEALVEFLKKFEAENG